MLRGCIRESKSGCDEGGERVVRREGVGGAADEGELGGGEARAARDRLVVDPLVLCVVVCRDPQDLCGGGQWVGVVSVSRRTMASRTSGGRAPCVRTAPRRVFQPSAICGVWRRVVERP